ncbi:MAG: hypothetical protein AB1345_11235 [Chloroflexota bacterium]
MAACNATAPTNLVVSRISPNQGRIDWTPGGGGVEQRLYVGANKAEVEAGCPGLASPACAVKEEGLATSTNTYTTGNVLTPGTLYYWRIVNFKDNTCQPASITKSLSSCALSPASITLEVGQKSYLTEMIYSSAEISKVDFSTTTDTVALDPTSDLTYVYSTEVTALRKSGANETTEISGDVYLVGQAQVDCTGTVDATVLAPGIEPGAGSTVTVAGEGSGPVGADGSYSVAGVSSGTGQTVSLTIGDPSQWVCSCPSGCSYGGVLAPKSGLDFFVTNQREAWFQTEGVCMPTWAMSAARFLQAVLSRPVTLILLPARQGWCPTAGVWIWEVLAQPISALRQMTGRPKPVIRGCRRAMAILSVCWRRTRGER